jgi:hypothetical protein
MRIHFRMSHGDCPMMKHKIKFLLIAGTLLLLSGVLLALSTAKTHAQRRPTDDTACLNCHTDKNQLVELAVGKEMKESLSEGPG